MIVLDTHVLIWWVNEDEKLSSPALKAINKEIASEDGQLIVSSITTWEIALLIKKGRLALTMDFDDWIDTVSSIECVRFVPIDNDVAIQSARLPGEFHPDPADRMITALARHLSVALVTCDEKIKAYKHVKTIW